jgi:peroxiredoxin
MRFKLIILLSIAFFSFKTYGQSEDYYKILIEIEGLQDSVAYLGYHMGEKKYVQDTSLISSNGVVSFSKPERLKKGVYFLYSNKGFYIEFLVKEQVFSFKTSKSDPYGDIKIKGSPENEIFLLFQLTMRDHQNKIRRLNKELTTAASKEDSTLIYDSARKIGELNIKKRDSLKSVYPDSYTAVLLRLLENSRKDFMNDSSASAETKRKAYNEYKNNFLSGINFTDEGTLRAPVFHAKVMEYMEKITFQNPDSVVASVDYILNKSKDNEEMYKYWLSTFFQKYQKTKIMGLDKAFVHIAMNYYLAGKVPWADQKMLTKLDSVMDFHKENQMGMYAPRLNLLDTLLDPIDLKMVSANYTVLFFYRPSCGHCKKSAPVLLDTYHGLQSEGVEVVGVNVDTDIEEWKKFIEEFQLDWVNASDPFTRSNFRREYNVTTTPTIYVLDSEKLIIAKKLGVEQIEGFIRDRIEFDHRDKL